MFQTSDLYPELIGIKQHLDSIKEEALLVRNQMSAIEDQRVELDVWNVFSLLPEEEDKVIVSDETWKTNQKLAPISTKILSEIEGLKAYAFSCLAPGGHIRPHKHNNPYVTAILCIQDGGDSYIKVEGEKKKFKNGEFIIFDYTKEHEVYNNGSSDRIVLLILLDNRDV
ncbi:aspartyl/asparaginyl beta-hydroxylase domain-containing protein [uncultured Aquimarina sp.]|uniref:aspartyl/asparaginyl beta-hydroxylase domain-containing protein n=1 Tax=uncultured Aquimarina sp. TaxID=575652 RepID=UPI00263567D4|nr:aspartyl/asparaginyl beta-hydroxylase domain-containing protein [uncultured Aquimarina sp.]